MKKYFCMCAAICASLVLASCGSSNESAYRKAYEKAKAQEQASIQQPQPQAQTPVVTPLVEAPAQQPVEASDVPVRSENVSVISGSGLKAYSVVVGSFGVRANAEGMASTLKAAGYDAQIAFNSERNMYRVIASTYDAKTNAIESRNSLRSKYPDAWLLMTR